MRASRALRPAMLRGILQAIVMLFLLRIFFWFLRLISAGSRTPGESDSVRAPRAEGGSRRRPLRVDHSNVTDVPFTEIPATPDTAAPLVESEPAERAKAR
jgi:hypothetical protein